MSNENQLKTAAGLSELWDGKPVTRVRSGDGASLLCGRRLSVHLMVQPAVSQLLLSNNGLCDQGIISRFLTVFPDSTCGHRFYKSLNPQNDSRFRAYANRMREILKIPMSIEEDGELIPRIIKMTPEAKNLWISFHDKVETELGKNGVLTPIRAMANKAPEHAARLAGILTILNDLHTNTIDASEMKHGTILAGYFLNEALRLFQSGSVDQRLEKAERLLEWLHRRDTDTVTLVEIYRFGINCVRTAKVARDIMGILQDHGWVIPMQEGAEFEGTQRKEAWKVVKQ